MRLYTGKTIFLRDLDGRGHTLWELVELPNCELDAYEDNETIPDGLFTTLAPHQIGSFKWKGFGLVIDHKPLVIANVRTLGGIIADNIAQAYLPEHLQ